MTINDHVALLYNETVYLPRFKASLDRLLSDYDFVLTEHHDISKDDLPAFVHKVISEGNAVLIEREAYGYFVVVWKD